VLYDYTTVTPESVAAAVDQAIAAGDRLAESVAAVSGTRTWGDTMAPLDEIGAVVVAAYGIGPFMGRVHPDKRVRDTATEAEERLIKWQSDLTFRRDLYEAVEAYAATAEAMSLAGEEARFLAFTRRDFRRAGHVLGDTERAEVQRIRTRLVELGVAFTRNIDEYQDGLDLSPEQLAGLPEDYVERLAPGSEQGTRRVSLDYPDYYPFMDLAHDRDLRRLLQFKFYNKAAEVNTPLLAETIELRREMASIFGLPSWAQYAMEEKMAREPKAVDAFYRDLIPPLQSKADEELADLRSALGIDDLEGWDHRYGHTKIKRERFGVDPSEVAAYFPLEAVVEGMLEITGEVFGLEYRLIAAPDAWHPDVAAYEIRDRDTGDSLAVFYADLFPREGKFGHAAAFDLVPGRAIPDGYQNPVTAIVANLTKPTAETPSLLKHEEVVTLFHEFGHVLHNSLGHTRLVRFTGFNTEWDFVEAPSQIMEHWCWSPEVLRRFARHHKTGEPIPGDLVDQLTAARDLHIGLAMLRQVSFGSLDMAFHGPGDHRDLAAITRETWEIARFPHHEGTFYPASFGHLFGYDAGYYGYLWSRVFGDDMFSRFETEGILDPNLGREYRAKVLEPGGSKDADELLRDFLGREPNQQAFLRHLGITESS
jgi:Zn-dependent oligopeptidase